MAKAASLSVMPKRSIKILGAVVFVPTSMPTWHIMPKKVSNTNGLPKRAKACENWCPMLMSASLALGSSISTVASNAVAKIPTTKKMAKRMRQL